MSGRLVAALTAVGLAVGCGGSQPKEATCDLAVGYTSLAGLRQAASAIAVIRPTGETAVRSIGSIPVTIARVKILQTVAGRRLPLTLGLQELGSSSVAPGPGCTPLVSNNNVYLAYLVPFRLRRTGPPVSNRYVSVGGGQGLFRHVGSKPLSDTSARSFVHAFPYAPASLPSRISILEAKQS